MRCNGRLLNEVDGIIEETKVGNLRDAAIFAAAPKEEPHEIATYGTLCVYAVNLGKTKPALLLSKTAHKNEKSHDDKLTEIAVSHNNLDPAHEGVQ